MTDLAVPVAVDAANDVDDPPAVRRVIGYGGGTRAKTVIAKDPRVETGSPPEQALNNGFLIAIALGIVSAVGGAFDSTWATVIGFGGPILTLLGFGGWGFFIRRFPQRADTRQKFADSCYFLGFLFTMFALMAGFLPAGLTNAEISSQQILRFFGMALGSSALGLIGRVLAIQGGRSIIDDHARIESDVRSYAETIAADAKGIAEAMAEARAAIRAEQVGTLEALTAPLRAQLDGIVVALSAQRDAIERSTALVTAKAEQETRDLDVLATQARDTQALLRTTVDGLGARVGALAAELGPLSAQSQRALSDVTANIRLLADNLGSVAARQGQVEAGFAAMTARSEAVAAGLDRLETAQADARERLSGEADTFRRDLDAAVTRFAAIVDRFSADLGAVRNP